MRHVYALHCTQLYSTSFIIDFFLSRGATRISFLGFATAVLAFHEGGLCHPWACLVREYRRSRTSDDPLSISRRSEGGNLWKGRSHGGHLGCLGMAWLGKALHVHNMAMACHGRAWYCNGHGHGHALVHVMTWPWRGMA